MNPEYQKLFPEFKSVAPDDLEKTNALYGHVKRVMKAVENAVSSMNDVETFTAYLEELGRRHGTPTLKPSYLDVSSTSYITVHFAQHATWLCFCKLPVIIMTYISHFSESVVRSLHYHQPSICLLYHK